MTDAQKKYARGNMNEKYEAVNVIQDGNSRSSGSPPYKSVLQIED